ncbi:MAG: hypothetical protein K2W78_01275 [Xanthobacteraceae bacterium]|nr:hypothetical protein [Xanthobacteraceae bacterium]
MLYQLEHSERLAALVNRLNSAAQPTEAAFIEVLETSERVAHAGQGRAAANLKRLISCEAWTEAALASIEVLTPRWKLCRLIYDGGEWFCSLSSHRDLPDWLDQVIESHHRDIGLSILTAVVEAMRNDDANRTPQTHKRLRVMPEALVLCENFF